MFSGPRPAYTHGLITQSVGGIGVSAYKYLRGTF